MHITISSVGCSLVAGFFYQLSSLNGNVEFFHSIKGGIIIALIMIFYPFPSFAILIPPEDYDASADYVRDNYNTSYDLFISTPSCNALKLDFKGKAHYGTLAVQVCIVWIVMSTVALKIHRKLNAMKNMLSSSTLKVRRQLLIALCLQTTIPLLLIVLPLVLMLISIIVGGKWINTISSLAMPIMAFHSLVNAILIIVVIKPYRNAVFNGIRKILWIKEKSSTIIVENTTQLYTEIPKSKNPRNIR